MNGKRLFILTILGSWPVWFGFSLYHGGVYQSFAMWEYVALLSWTFTTFSLMQIFRGNSFIRTWDWRAFAGACLILFSSHVVATKYNPSFVPGRLGNFITFNGDKIYGDDTGLIPEAATLSAVAAFNRETDGIVAYVSNGLSDASATLDTQIARLSSTNLNKRLYVALDAPRDMPGVIANHNLAITREKMTLNPATGVLNIWFRYSWRMDEAADVQFTAYLSTDRRFVFSSYTNTFPVVETITNADGIDVDCYRYDYDVSSMLSQCANKSPAIFAPYTADFGGANGEAFEVPGTGVAVMSDGGAVTNIGVEVTIRDWPEPFGTNLVVGFVGGVAVEMHWRGEKIAGDVLIDENGAIYREEYQ